jgi:transposase-like protein
MIDHRHRRHSTAFKLELVRQFLDGRNTMAAVARAHDITRSLLRVWVAKHARGELTPDVQRTESSRDAQAHVAALERKVGQLTMELDALKKGDLVEVRVRNGRPLIITGPRVAPSRKDAE